MRRLPPLGLHVRVAVAAEEELVVLARVERVGDEAVVRRVTTCARAFANVADAPVAKLYMVGSGCVGKTPCSRSDQTPDFSISANAGRCAYLKLSELCKFLASRAPTNL